MASVGYGAATFLAALLGLYEVEVFGATSPTTPRSSSETFVLFLIILAVAT